MWIEVIAIGDEILKGDVINSNASFISEHLKKKGYLTARHKVISDDLSSLQEELKETFEKADLVITTGGLGPTLDDLTKKGVAEFFSSELIYNEDVAKDLKKRYANLSSIQEQSMVPAKAAVMQNTVGTAPGFIFQQDNQCLIVLPGVPKEMEQMLLDQALPYIEKHFLLAEKMYTDFLHICQLSEIHVDEKLRKLKEIDPEVAIGIYPKLGLLHVTFTVSAKNASDAENKIKPLKEKLISDLSTYVYFTESGKIEEALHEELTERKKTFAIAESCTGGLLSSRVTSLSGASVYFWGSVVVYSNEAKQKVLNVSSKTLSEKGAVSVETVEEMAKGLLNVSNVDYAVTISGIAGPDGGTPQIPVGTVCIAIAERGKKIHSGIIYRKRDRYSVMDSTANFVFSSLWRLIVHNCNPEFS